MSVWHIERCAACADVTDKPNFKLVHVAFSQPQNGQLTYLTEQVPSLEITELNGDVTGTNVRHCLVEDHWPTKKRVKRATLEAT